MEGDNRWALRDTLPTAAPTSSDNLEAISRYESWNPGDVDLSMSRWHPIARNDWMNLLDAHRWGRMVIDSDGHRSLLPHCLSSAFRHLLRQVFFFERLLLRAWLVQVRIARPVQYADTIELFVSTGTLPHEDIPREARHFARPAGREIRQMKFLCDWCGHPHYPAPPRCPKCARRRGCGTLVYANMFVSDVPFFTGLGTRLTTRRESFPGYRHCGVCESLTYLDKEFDCMLCLTYLCTRSTCRLRCPTRSVVTFPGDGTTQDGCGGRFCPTCLPNHICVFPGMVLIHPPVVTDARFHHEVPCVQRSDTWTSYDEIAYMTLTRQAMAPLPPWRVAHSFRFPLEHQSPRINCWIESDPPHLFCGGLALERAHSAGNDAFRSDIRISDQELYYLRKWHEFCCHDGPFLWLRTWHQVMYNGDQMEFGIHGYVFPVLVTGMRQAGWEPDVGAFFLEHSPHCGPWPVHVTRSIIWQQLLSTSLGPAFCVCTPSYATVRYSPPFHGTVLAC